MIRKSRFGRSARAQANNNAARPEYFRPRLEPLEERKLLTTNDLMISTYEDTGGLTVLRYNEITHQAVPGGVAYGDHNVRTAQGLAVDGADASYYVSSVGPAFTEPQVTHYDADGTFLNTIPGSIFFPGTLIFGPNGNLYIGDIGAQSIHQVDPGTQTIVKSTFVGFAPGGITFASDDQDLIVGNLDQQSVVRYDSDSPNTGDTPTTLVNPGSGINPAGFLIRPSDGDLLIADFDFGQEPQSHHRVVRHDFQGAQGNFDTLIDIPADDEQSLPPQPLSLLVDHGDLLVGMSPDHLLNGSVRQYDIDTGAFIETILSGIGTPSALAFAPSINSVVAGRHLFYNESGTGGATVRYDGNDLAINSLDDNAIATDKVAYLPGTGPATFANVSSYSKGINGIMIDLAGAHGSISTSDFIFKVGNNNTPSAWSNANAPTSVSVRAGAGVSGSDRVEITWNSGAPTKAWLEVIVLANANTGLVQKAGYPAVQGDVFFFGNALGNSGAGDTVINSTVNAIDEGSARNNPQVVGNNIPITNLYDFNRNAIVNAVDEGISRNNATNSSTVLKYINIGSPPSAPEGDGGVASALAAPATLTSQTFSANGNQVSVHLTVVGSNPELVASFWQHVARDSARIVRGHRSPVDSIVHKWEWLEDLVDSIFE